MPTPYIDGPLTAPTVGPCRGLTTRPRTISPPRPSTATAATPWATTRSGRRSGSILYVPANPFTVALCLSPVQLEGVVKSALAHLGGVSGMVGHGRGGGEGV